MCPHEGDSESFEKAKREKIEKYTTYTNQSKTGSGASTKRMLSLTTSYIVGSLGLQDIANDKVLKRRPKYANVFRKLCTVNAIKDSLAARKSKG